MQTFLVASHKKADSNRCKQWRKSGATWKRGRKVQQGLLQCSTVSPKTQFHPAFPICLPHVVLKSKASLPCGHKTPFRNFWGIYNSSCPLRGPPSTASQYTIQGTELTIIPTAPRQLWVPSADGRVGVPDHQATPGHQLGILQFNLSLAPPAQRQHQIPQVKGPVPRDQPSPPSDTSHHQSRSLCTLTDWLYRKEVRRSPSFLGFD